MYNEIKDKDKRVNKQKCGTHCVKVVCRTLKESINAHRIIRHKNYDKRTFAKSKLVGFFEKKTESISLKISCKVKKLVALLDINCAAYC